MITVRDRSWQWRRAASDAAMCGLLGFGAIGVISGLSEHGDWWRWVLSSVAGVVAAGGCVIAWLRTGVSLDGSWLTIRNPLRTRRIDVGEMVALTAMTVYGKRGYLAVVRQSSAGRNSVLPIAALPSTAARDPDVLAQLPFLLALVERSFQ